MQKLVDKSRPDMNWTEFGVKLGYLTAGLLVYGLLCYNVPTVLGCSSLTAFSKMVAQKEGLLNRLV